MSAAFRPRFRSSSILSLAARYAYAGRDSETVVLASVRGVKERGYLTKTDLERLAFWKAPRSAGGAKQNLESYVRAVTQFALSTKDERARIEALTILDGVAWPTASCILHFFHSDPYPVLDFRALESLSVDAPSQYTFHFWWSYVECCRQLARAAGTDMRTLDRALWQWSKENG